MKLFKVKQNKISKVTLNIHTSELILRTLLLIAFLGIGGLLWGFICIIILVIMHHIFKIHYGKQTNIKNNE